VTPGPAFEQLIIPRAGVVGDGQGFRPGEVNPVPAWLHRSEKSTNRLVIYVPGSIEGTPSTGRHDYRPLAAALAKFDCSLLLAQMSSAQATVYALFEDCVSDIAAVIEHAKSIGYDEIGLIGLSMGGPRVAYWNAVAGDAAVKSFVLLGTIESSYLASKRMWDGVEAAEQSEILERCRDLVATGRDREIVVGKLLSRELPLAAASYLSFLGEPHECNAGTVQWLDEINVPSAVVHSRKDTAAPPEGAQAIFEGLSHIDDRELIWCDSGGHQMLLAGKVAQETSAAVARRFETTLA